MHSRLKRISKPARILIIRMTFNYNLISFFNSTRPGLLTNNQRQRIMKIGHGFQELKISAQNWPISENVFHLKFGWRPPGFFKFKSCPIYVSEWIPKQ